jgi:hypothetical protein
MRPPTGNSLWARLLCTIRYRIRSSTSVGCVVGAQRPMLGAICTRLFSIAPAFARFAVVTGSGDSSALGEKRVVLKGSHDVHVLGSVRRVVVGGFPTRAEESGKPMETGADDTAARSAEMVFLSRGLGRVVFVPHDGILVGILRTQRLFTVIVVYLRDVMLISRLSANFLVVVFVFEVLMEIGPRFMASGLGSASSKTGICNFWNTTQENIEQHENVHVFKNVYVINTKLAHSIHGGILQPHPWMTLWRMLPHSSATSSTL